MRHQRVPNPSGLSFTGLFAYLLESISRHFRHLNHGARLESLVATIGTIRTPSEQFENATLKCLHKVTWACGIRTFPNITLSAHWRLASAIKTKSATPKRRWRCRACSWSGVHGIPNKKFLFYSVWSMPIGFLGQVWKWYWILSSKKLCSFVRYVRGDIVLKNLTGRTCPI